MYLRHLKLSHFWGKFPCASCNYNAKFAEELIHHIDSAGHEVDSIDCPSCYKSFHKSDISSHYESCITRQVRGRAQKKDIINATCHTCGKLCSRRNYYKAHILMHMRKQEAKEEDI